uniref:AWS domain-containing protein n=1 Tax=Chromera velia CCMP2878 TaxID=1169474 RepID=A0A0G4HKS2_9ALVE|eukprot:Cvel_28520.t1-p1 / transcript=Cvel_28520.t1 / gene=Cvel_28520 / organism=Chromera_velia_CCMP2878 / gene_product=hypothetical protein / transcript_product=hypothetical protein / location=Cvel_scaffold3752:4728-7665(-) / protein_length=424 / sequence_SO=supercontig / SO=protein_coding / is_pseudo=false
MAAEFLSQVSLSQAECNRDAGSNREKELESHVTEAEAERDAIISRNKELETRLAEAEAAREVATSRMKELETRLTGDAVAREDTGSRSTAADSANLKMKKRRRAISKPPGDGDGREQAAAVKDLPQKKRRQTQNGLFPYTREGEEVEFKVRWRDEKNVKRARTFTFAQYGDKAEEEATKLRDEKVSKEDRWAVYLPEGQSESYGGREAAILRGEEEKPPNPYEDCLKGISASDLKMGPQSKADVAAIPASEKQRPRKGVTWRETNQTWNFTWWDSNLSKHQRKIFKATCYGFVGAKNLALMHRQHFLKNGICAERRKKCPKKTPPTADYFPLRVTPLEETERLKEALESYMRIEKNVCVPNKKTVQAGLPKIYAESMQDMLYQCKLLNAKCDKGCLNSTARVECTPKTYLWEACEEHCANRRFY